MMKIVLLVYDFSKISLRHIVFGANHLQAFKICISNFLNRLK